MEPSRFMNSRKDDQQRALEGLLDAFSSVFSLEDIADAYCKAGKNATLAGAMLYDMQESTSTSSNSTTNNETRIESSSESSLEVPYPENGSYKVSKTKTPPASMGTVSAVLGNSYWRPKPMPNRTVGTNKPLKLDGKDLLMSEICGKELGSGKDDSMHVDVEDFLVKMLGEGFKFDRDMIHQVLGSCGYDIDKSMEILLDLSATTLAKRGNVHCQSIEKSSEKCLGVEDPSCDESNHNRVLRKNGIQRPVAPKERSDIQKEVLTSLFKVPEWSGNSSKITSPVSALKRSSPFGQLVVEPLREFPTERDTGTINQHPEIENDEEDSYKLLRKAVMEYRAMTKEYFKSAVEAFVKGDRVRADNLLEQGLFFQRKARETDEESEQKIFDTRDEEAHETMSLDLLDLGAKEAVRLLKCHLSSLSGIPSMTYLKVIMEGNNQDISKGARKRMIMRLLEKESIKWIEEGDSGTIVIRLDEINRTHLSFAKK